MFEIIKAVVVVGLPIGFISYWLSIYVLKKTGLQLEKIKDAKKQLNSEVEKNMGFWEKQLLNKWMKFGGGFYGTVTFLTYLHIEIFEVIDFIKDFKGLELISIGAAISLATDFFVNSIMNLVQAFTWPFYWKKYLPIESFWVWVGAALAGHIVASKWAYYRFKKDKSQ